MLADDLLRLAEWIEHEGRSWRMSFEYQGGSALEAKYRAKAAEVRAMAERVRGKGGAPALERLRKEPPTVVTWSGNDTIPSDRWLSALMDVLTAHQAALDGLQAKLDEEG